MQLKLSQEAAALKDLVMPVLSCINSSVEKLADFSQSEVQQAQAAQKFDGVTSMLEQLQSGIQNVCKRVLDVESMQSDTKAFAIGTRDAFEASLQSIDQSITYVLEDCRAEKAPVLQELDLLSAQQAKLSQRLGVLLEMLSLKCSQDANPSCELQTVFEELAKLSVSMNTVLEQQEKLLESPKPDVAMDDSAEEAKVSPELGLLLMHEQALATIKSNLGNVLDLLSDRRADVQELRIKQKPSGQQIKPDQGWEETTATTVHDLDASLRDMLQKMADAVEAQKPAMEDMKSLKFKVEQLGLLCSSISTSVDMIREPGAGPDSTSSSQDVGHQANPCLDKLDALLEEHSKLSMSMSTVQESLLSSQQQAWSELQDMSHSLCDRLDQHKPEAVEIRRVKHRVEQLGQLFCQQLALSKTTNDLLQGNESNDAGFWEDEALSSWKKLFPSTN